MSEVKNDDKIDESHKSIKIWIRGLFIKLRNKNKKPNNLNWAFEGFRFFYQFTALADAQLSSLTFVLTRPQCPNIGLGSIFDLASAPRPQCQNFGIGLDATLLASILVPSRNFYPDPELRVVFVTLATILLSRPSQGQTFVHWPPNVRDGGQLKAASLTSSNPWRVWNIVLFVREWSRPKSAWTALAIDRFLPKSSKMWDFCQNFKKFPCGSTFSCYSPCFLTPFPILWRSARAVLPVL